MPVRMSLARIGRTKLNSNGKRGEELGTVEAEKWSTEEPYRVTEMNMIISLSVWRRLARRCFRTSH